MRLHMGSGTWYAEGWVNVDIEAPGAGFRAPDFLADVFALPFENGTFDQIYLGHFLEHIRLEDIPAAMDELHRVALPSCEVAVVGPCIELAQAQHEPEWLIEAIRAHDPPPGGHAWTATTALTKQTLEDAGLRATQVHISEIAPPNWCNPNSFSTWQCAFLARWPTV